MTPQSFIGKKQNKKNPVKLEHSFRHNLKIITSLLRLLHTCETTCWCAGVCVPACGPPHSPAWRWPRTFSPSSPRTTAGQWLKIEHKHIHTHYKLNRPLHRLTANKDVIIIIIVVIIIIIIIILILSCLTTYWN